MLSLIRRWLPRAAPACDPQPPAAPEGIVSVVGDVHGCVQPLSDLLARLPGQIVLVGDLVDRGEHSAAVIDMVMARPDILCLMGNHEEMLLAFLDDPVGAGAGWLRHGGLQTLASYGVSGDLTAAHLPHLRDGLARAMGEAQIAWLRSRPLFHRSGNLVVSHAGADPARPVDQQTRSLIWGHPDCGRLPRADGLWIVHGHVVVPAPDIRQGVIRVDTGAYADGPLSAAVLGDGPLRFETSG